MFKMQRLQACTRDKKQTVKANIIMQYFLLIEILKRQCFIKTKKTKRRAQKKKKTRLFASVRTSRIVQNLLGVSVLVLCFLIELVSTIFLARDSNSVATRSSLTLWRGCCCAEHSWPFLSGSRRRPKIPQILQAENRTRSGVTCLWLKGAGRSCQYATYGNHDLHKTTDGQRIIESLRIVYFKDVRITL